MSFRSTPLCPGLRSCWAFSPFPPYRDVARYVSTGWDVPHVYIWMFHGYTLDGIFETPQCDVSTDRACNMYIHGKYHPMRAESPMRSEPRVKRSDTLGIRIIFPIRSVGAKEWTATLLPFQGVGGIGHTTRPRVSFRSTPLCPGLRSCWTFSPHPCSHQRHSANKTAER